MPLWFPITKLVHPVVDFRFYNLALSLLVIRFYEMKTDKKNMEETKKKKRNAAFFWFGFHKKNITFKTKDIL